MSSEVGRLQMWPMNNAALHVELGRLTAQLAAERAEIERLRADLAAERALADDLAVDLASVMSAAEYEHRDPGSPLTRWEARRER